MRTLSLSGLIVMFGCVGLAKKCLMVEGLAEDAGDDASIVRWRGAITAADDILLIEQVNVGLGLVNTIEGLF
jgi:hypothetical protein